MGLRDLLHGSTSLVRLSASYALGRPSRVLPALRVAWDVTVRVRRAPILRAGPELLVAPDELAAMCSLVSDTHVTAPDALPCELELDRGQWPWHEAPDGTGIAAGLRRVLHRVARDAPRTVIWCGDEVDTGSAVEWARLRALIDDVPGLSHRMVPGNHDVAFNRPFYEDHDLTRRAARESAYEAIAGTLHQFPIVDTLIGDAASATIVLLDSCRHPSTHVLSNAIGVFGAPQLRRLAAILARTRGPVLCVAHHHVWRDPRFTQPDAWFNTAIDADELAALLFAYRRRDPRNHVLVCHGHRHAMTAGWIDDHHAPRAGAGHHQAPRAGAGHQAPRAGAGHQAPRAGAGHGDASIAIVGMPSSTLGDKSLTGQLDGRLRYAIAGLRADGSWGVALRDVGALTTLRTPTGGRRPPTPTAELRAYSLVGAGTGTR